MNTTIYFTTLFSLLLNCTIEATTNSPINPIDIATTPQAPQGPATNNQQSVVSTCHAVRAVTGHDGEIAQWKAKCRIEIWTDKEQPKLEGLGADERAKVLAELGGQQPAATPGLNYKEMFDKSRYLADEAANRHSMCMEAKRSILYQLKLQLPAGLTSCEKITQVMNDLKLTKELEAFIDQVSGPMKALVANIHAIEQNTTLPEMVRMEAIRAAKTELTTLLDENCKDDHPSIRYHNVGYMPNPDLDKVKMTLVVTHPGKRVVFFNLPEESFGPHIENLKHITEAGLYHGQKTGQQGLFEGTNRPIGQFGSENSVPSDSSVTSFTQPEPKAAALTVSPPKQNSMFGAFSNPFRSAPAAPVLQVQQNAKPKNDNNDALNAKINEFAITMKSHGDKATDAAVESSVQSFLSQESIETVPERSSEQYDKSSSTKNFWGKKYAALSQDEKAIELEYQKKKELLSNAQAELKATEPKKYISLLAPLSDKVYSIGKKVIKAERKSAADKLKQTSAIVAPLPANPDKKSVFGSMFNRRSSNQN